MATPRANLGTCHQPGLNPRPASPNCWLCKHAKTVCHKCSYAKRQNNQQLYCWLPDTIYADYGNSGKQAYIGMFCEPLDTAGFSDFDIWHGYNIENRSNESGISCWLPKCWGRKSPYHKIESPIVDTSMRFHKPKKLFRTYSCFRKPCLGAFFTFFCQWLFSPSQKQI